MQEANEMRDRLIREFTEGYMEKLFYFCLKKTGCRFEAEDLTQDIALKVITALNKGTLPTSFSAWVWQIARNSYCTWAEKKHKRSESVTGADIGDYEISDESENILGEMIRAEQLALLRRELAFIGSDYRDIVVAYYIENRSIRDIANSLSLSTNTVKSKLFRARKILKEGMDMAREFGIRSYKPEEVYFGCSCDSFGTLGQPWNVLDHKFYKNIFLEAYGNPSTAEELSLELGIALPYMEDELAYLTKETFLIKNGNKYETSFPIISKNAQEKVWNYTCRVLPRLTELFTKLVDDFTKACDDHGINYYGKYQSYEDAKWTLLMHAFDEFINSAKPRKNFEYTKRPDNGRWDIVGYQKSNVPDVPFIGRHGCPERIVDKPAANFWQYKFQYNNIKSKTPNFLSHEEGLALKSVAQGEWDTCEQYLLDKLLDYGYIIKAEDGYKPTVLVFDGRTSENYLAKFTDIEKKCITATASEIRRILNEMGDFGHKTMKDDLPSSMSNNENLIHFLFGDFVYDRRYVFDQALKNGWLKYDDNTINTIGAYIYL